MELIILNNKKLRGVLPMKYVVSFEKNKKYIKFKI